LSEPPPKNKTPISNRGVSAGFEIAGAVAVLSLLGYWFDSKLNTSPWGIIVGAVTGIVGGLYNIVRPAVLQMLRDNASRQKQDQNKKNGH